MSGVLVTGITGHIGSHLWDHWDWSRWSHLKIVDNFSTGRQAVLFQRQPNLPPIELFETDICTVDWNHALRGVDTVIHCAALTDAANSHDKRDLVMAVNFDATMRLADACRAHGCRLFFPSTTSVYGPQSVRVDESCTPDVLAPQSPYAESKLRAEQALHDAAAHGLACTILRCGTIYGAARGMRFHTAVNKFIWQACWNQPITVWRTAYEQFRPYLGLADCADALSLLVQQPSHGTLYNIVSRNSTVRDVVDAIRPHVPDVRIDFVDSPIMNQQSYHVDGARLRALGWAPHAELADAVAATVHWLRGGMA